MEYYASSVGELIDVVEDIHNLYVRDEKYEHHWYRGHADASWRLIPSAQRVVASEEELRGLANDFRIRASRIVGSEPNREDYSSWLAMMQHYGIPTRLLDWSESPLIAAFFATEMDSYDLLERDACVWVLRPSALNMRLGDGFLYPLDSSTAHDMMQSAFVPYETEFVKEKDVLACHYVGGDTRMYAQQACFTVHRSSDAQLDGPDFEEYVHRIVIPAAAKERVRLQLTMLGITTGFVYPDLDHVAQSLRRLAGI